MIDSQAIGQLAVELIDDVERDYEGVETTLVRAMVIVEVKYPHPEEDDKMRTTIQWARTDPSPSGNIGLAVNVLKGLLF